MDDVLPTVPQTTPSPVATPSVITPPQPQAAPPSTPQKNKWLVPLVLVGVAIIGVSSYFVATLLNTPVKIKEAINTSQPLVDSLEKTNAKIAEHLKKDMDLDQESIDRYSQEGDNLIRSSTNDIESTSALAEKMSSSSLKEYKDALVKYVDLSTKLVNIEKENVRMAKLYKSPLKKYQDMQVMISGASSYMYSDTPKYLTMVDQAIQSETDIIKEVKNIKPNSTFSDANDAIIKMWESELEFITKMRAAVQNRSQSQIADAQKIYTQAALDLQTESNKATDKFESNITTHTDDLDSAYKKLSSQMDFLRRKYNF